MKNLHSFYKKYKVVIQFVFGILLGGVFLYLTFRNRSLFDIYEDIKNASMFWSALSLVFLYFTLYIRALRWKLMLKSSDENVKNNIVFNSILIGYLVNSVTPRLGEIARCSALYKSSQVPVSKSLGTVVSERIIDIIILFAGLILIFFLEVEKLNYLTEHIFNSSFSFLTTQNIIIVFLSSVVFFIASYFILKKHLPRTSFINKIIAFTKEVVKSGLKVFQFKEFNKFFIQTIFIWVLLILMNFCYIMALDETKELNLYFAMIVLFIGGIGWAMPTPSGIGTTHFIIVQLFLAFGFSESTGQNFAVLSNGITIIGTISFGLIAWFAFMYRTTKSNRKKIFEPGSAPVSVND